MMRVGFDARWFNDSGVGSYVSGLLCALARLDSQCELFVYEDPQNPVPDLDNSNFRRIPLSAPKYSASEQFELARRTRHDKLDLFHSPFYVIPLAASCPVVATIHDVIPFLFSMPPWPKQQVVKLGYRAAALKSSHLIAVSANTAKDIQRVLHVPASKLTTIYNGIAREHFHANRAPDEIAQLRRQFKLASDYVVFPVPRNYRTKNLQVAIRALAQARRDLDFQIVAYGPGKNLDSLLTGTGLQDRVIGAGFLPTADLAVLFRHASAFLFTSLYEGFGLPVVEAMACGCPVVSSSGGSLSEVAADGAQVFPSTDEAGMAAALINLLRHPEQRALWRDRALRRAACFSWERAAEQTLDLYRQLVPASSPANAREWSRA